MVPLRSSWGHHLFGCIYGTWIRETACVTFLKLKNRDSQGDRVVREPPIFVIWHQTYQNINLQLKKKKIDTKKSKCRDKLSFENHQGLSKLFLLLKRELNGFSRRPRRKTLFVASGH